MRTGAKDGPLLTAKNPVRRGELPIGMPRKLAIAVRARAKLNLTLDVRGIRPDGYHELESVFVTLELADRLVLRGRNRAGRALWVTRGEPLEAGSTSSCLEAARRLASGRGDVPGVTILLRKRIPVASGLGGGSADAAAVLRGLNHQWGLGLTRRRLARLAADLGSDVPFCLSGGLALVRGRGERLRPLPPPPRPLWLVLLRPPGAKSTAQVYRNFDLLPSEALTGHRPDNRAAMRALADGDWSTLAGALGNVLEPALSLLVPEVCRARRLLAEAGALGTAMTGSGPTMFGLAADAAHARAVACRVRAALGDDRRWWLSVTRLDPESRS